MKYLLAVPLVLGGLIYALAQFVAAYGWVDGAYGSGWAFGLLLAAFMFRFTLPVTICAFLGAWHWWGWHWALAAIFAAPGLVLVLPGVIAGLVAAAASLFGRGRSA